MPEPTDEVAFLLRGALRAHSHWRARFTMAIDGRRAAELDPLLVRRSDRCALGMLLASPEQRARLASSPELLEVEALHSEFHRCAGDVAAMMGANHFEQARRAIMPGTPYDAVSLALEKALVFWCSRLMARRCSSR